MSELWVNDTEDHMSQLAPHTLEGPSLAVVSGRGEESAGQRGCAPCSLCLPCSDRTLEFSAHMFRTGFQGILPRAARVPTPRPKSVQVSLGRRAGWSVPCHADQAGLAGEGERAAGQGHSKRGEWVGLTGT